MGSKCIYKYRVGEKSYPLRPLKKISALEIQVYAEQNNVIMDVFTFDVWHILYDPLTEPEDH